jgi:hypothetical protein
VGMKKFGEDGTILRFSLMLAESIIIFCFVYLSLNKCLAVDETNTLKELVIITAMKMKSLF